MRGPQLVKVVQPSESIEFWQKKIDVLAHGSGLVVVASLPLDKIGVRSSFRIPPPLGPAIPHTASVLWSILCNRK